MKTNETKMNNCTVEAKSGMASNGNGAQAQKARRTKVGFAICAVKFKDGVIARVKEIELSYTYRGLINGPFCLCTRGILERAKDEGVLIEPEMVDDPLYNAFCGNRPKDEHNNYGKCLEACKFKMLAVEESQRLCNKAIDVIWFEGFDSMNQKPLIELLQEAASKVEFGKHCRTLSMVESEDL